MTRDAYAEAGVSFDSAEKTTGFIAGSAATTLNARVIAGVGSFGAVYDMSNMSGYPYLVASSDTCGTKTMVAAELKKWEGIGHDIVNHSVNDILVQGAKPLFMLDTISANKLDPETVRVIVAGIAEACKTNDCVLIGGETAEVPGLIAEGQIDVAGTIIGTVDKPDLLPTNVTAGDVLVGLTSNGLHTNGYTLARKIATEFGYDSKIPVTDRTLGEMLLYPHRSYLKVLEPAIKTGMVKALAHITGGGIIDNLPRVLPTGCGAVIASESWEIPPLFEWLCEKGDLGFEEAYRVFNMGVGMIAVVDATKVNRFRAMVKEPSFIIGQVDRSGETRII